jgi:hypothetical protein
MDDFVRNPVAIAKLSPEQHRVTQLSGTDLNQLGGKP